MAKAQMPDEAEQDRKALAGAAGGERRAVAVAGAPPDDRAGDAPAVEREGGDDVEDEQHRVDERRASRPAPAAAWRRTRLRWSGRALRRDRCRGSAPPRRCTAASRMKVTIGPAAATLQFLARRSAARGSSARGRRRTTGRCRRSVSPAGARRARGRARAGSARRSSRARRRRRPRTRCSASRRGLRGSSPRASRSGRTGR